MTWPLAITHGHQQQIAIGTNTFKVCAFYTMQATDKPTYFFTDLVCEVLYGCLVNNVIVIDCHLCEWIRLLFAIGCCSTWCCAIGCCRAVFSSTVDLFLNCLPDLSMAHHPAPRRAGPVPMLMLYPCEGVGHMQRLRSSNGREPLFERQATISSAHGKSHHGPAQLARVALQSHLRIQVCVSALACRVCCVGAGRAGFGKSWLKWRERHRHLNPLEALYSAAGSPSSGPGPQHTHFLCVN